jgi:cytochrome P450
VTAIEDRPLPPPVEIDINDGHLYDDPWETYRWLRDNDPCFWDDKNQIWVVSRHVDVAYVSRTTDLYCAKHGVRPKVAAPMSLSDGRTRAHPAAAPHQQGLHPRQVKRLDRTSAAEQRDHR